MSSEYYSGASYILGGAEAQQNASNTPKAKSELGKDDFLTLLVAQLSHQDPLNPVDDKEFTGQLAQFSSLEQLTNINTGIQSLVDAKSQDDMFTAVSFIGKSIKAEGYNVSKSGDSVSTIYYGLGEAVSNIQVNIYDADGSIVRSETLGSRGTGSYEYHWDGKDSSGVAVPDGTYSVGMLGEDADGKPVMITTEMAGEVGGVVSSNGQQYLRLTDGRYVSFANITEIVPSGSDFGDDDPTGEDGTDDDTNS